MVTAHALSLAFVAVAIAPRLSLAQEATTTPLDYAASAGFLNVGQDPERPDIEMFHVDYILNGTDPATRPVTFLVNGGPGAATI